MNRLVFFSFLAILFVIACQTATGDHEKNNTNPALQNDSSDLKGSIDVKTAKRLVKNFEPRSFRRNNEVGFYDTRCVWFPIDQLDTLIQKIRREGGHGIRFYLAAYDRDSVPADHNHNYRDHTTLIMVSTKDSLIARGDTLHVDYFGDNIKHRTGAIITTSPENQGELCPPPTPCSEVGAKLFQQD